MVKWINAHITIPLSKDVYEKVKRHSEVRWGSVVRKMVIEYVNKLEVAGVMLNQSDCECSTEKNRLIIHLTASLPEDEYERIKKYPEIKWGAVARKALIQYLNELEKSRELLD